MKGKKLFWKMDSFKMKNKNKLVVIIVALVVSSTIHTTLGSYSMQAK